MASDNDCPPRRACGDGGADRLTESQEASTRRIINRQAPGGVGAHSLRCHREGTRRERAGGTCAMCDSIRGS